MKNCGHVLDIAVLTVYLVFLVHTLQAAKILILSIPDGSRFLTSFNIGKELKLRGHNVYMATDILTSKSTVELIENAGLHTICFDIDIISSNVKDFVDARQKIIQDSIEIKSSLNMFQFISVMIPIRERAKSRCQTFFTNITLLKKVEDAQFDLVVVDGAPPLRCLMLGIPYALNLPYVVEFISTMSWKVGIPVLPSYLPNFLSTFGEEMSLWERIQNFYLYALFTDGLFSNLGDDGKTFTSKFFPERKAVSYGELLQGASLILRSMSDDLHLMDYHYPDSPHILNTGGISARLALPLSRHLDNFMSISTHGVIVVSFGTYIDKHIPQYVIRTLFEAFAQLQQNVLFKFSENIHEDLPDNVRLEKWLPQNDVLGHSNTKVFITHCGNGGLFEGLYHGVPMLGVPIYGDQPHNAVRLTSKGYGISVNIFTITSKELVVKIKLLIDDPKYSLAVKKASSIFRSQPMTTVQKIGYWIDHVLKYGSSHLKPSYAMSMTWYSYFMVDVLVVHLILFYFLYRSLKLMLNKCRKLRVYNDKKNK